MDLFWRRGAARNKACLLLVPFTFAARLVLAAAPPCAAPLSILALRARCLRLRGGRHSAEESEGVSRAAAALASTETDSTSELGMRRQFRAESPPPEGVERDDFAAVLRQRGDSAEEETQSSVTESSVNGRVSDGQTRHAGRKGKKRKLERERASESSASLAGSRSEDDDDGDASTRRPGKSLESDSTESAAAAEERRKRSRKPVLGSEQKGPEYQDTRPMICKEFAEKGVCRYGLSCIFVHDRTSYYNKWKEKLREQRRRAKLAAFQANLISEHCPICKDSYTEPVVTQCDHYFCSRCIIERYDGAENPGAGQGGSEGGSSADGLLCPVCRKPLHGVFNLVYDLQDKLAEQQLKQIDPSKITVSPKS